LPGEVRGRNEVVRFVVQGERALEGEEFVLRLHTTKGEDAGQFKLTHLIRIFFAKILPLQLDSHRCHVLDSLSN